MSRRTTFWILLFGLSFSIVFAMVELTSYYFFYVESKSPGEFDVHRSREIVFDPTIGWIGSRGLDKRMEHGIHWVNVQINSDGFREEEFEQKLDRAELTGAKKILMLGDSQLYGWGIEENERLSNQLAELARLDGARNGANMPHSMCSCQNTTYRTCTKRCLNLLSAMLI